MAPIARTIGFLALVYGAVAAPQGFGGHGFNRHTTTAEATTTAVASTTEAAASTTTAAASTTTAAASSAAASTTTAAASSAAAGGAGKRGAAYNDASLVDVFEGSSEVTWAYNWASSSGGLSSDFDYVPLLWGDTSASTDDWSANAQAAIDAGSSYLMSFNEPDLSTQSDITPAAAASAFLTYMQPFAGSAKLGSPAVTNGGSPMGLTWLSEFLDDCTGCTIDFIPIHWYGSSSNAADLEAHIADAYSTGGGKPVWITEFGCTDGTDAEIQAFLETVMPWMDSQSYVERYAYFWVADGYLLSTGDTLSDYGETYATYT